MRAVTDQQPERSNPAGAREIAAGLRARFGRCLVFAAHPDDETISAGALIANLPGTVVVHVTDGAPRDLQDARASGFDTREDYARARAQEAREAAEILGVAHGNVRMLGVVDQEASLDLSSLTRRVLDAMRDVDPGFVLTHSYEGGHPDHDATAFAVHAAARLLQERVSRLPVFEFPSYHNATGTLSLARFIDRETSWAADAVLSPDECDLKRRATRAYQTQLRVIAGYPIEVEHYRTAPDYLFTEPPHPGILHYEQFNWGIGGNPWRANARETLAALGLSERL
jgi:LmbE family N-acetylglucosaminyl deacetylase